MILLKCSKKLVEKRGNEKNVSFIYCDVFISDAGKEEFILRDGVDSKCIKSIKIEVIDKKGKEEINISTQFSNDKETIRILRKCLILLEQEASQSSTN